MKLNKNKKGKGDIPPNIDKVSNMVEDLSNFMLNRMNERKLKEKCASKCHLANTDFCKEICKGILFRIND
jgi:hypothetical protein